MGNKLKVDIGIDPDSKAHGVAVYENKHLKRLVCLPAVGIIAMRSSFQKSDAMRVTWHIENVAKRNIVFPHKLMSDHMANMKVAHSIGRCAQSQLELENLIRYFWPEDKIILCKISKEWKNKEGKLQFERMTGWNKQSNEDSRSAAYFGFWGSR